MCSGLRPWVWHRHVAYVHCSVTAGLIAQNDQASQQRPRPASRLESRADASPQVPRAKAYLASRQPLHENAHPERPLSPKYMPKKKKSNYVKSIGIYNVHKQIYSVSEELKFHEERDD